MKIEEIENIWAHQAQPAAIGAPPALTAQIRRGIRHHVWFRKFMVATTVFCVVAMQVLFYVNGRYDEKYWSALHWVSLVFTQTVTIFSLYCLIRSLRRNQEALRRRGDTLQAVTETAFANVQSEMADYRGAGWFFLLGVGMSMLSVYANFPNPQADWQPLLSRFVFIVMFFGCIALAVRKHYRKNLVPECDRLQHTLQELRG